MELVRGVPITRYCDQEKVNTVERIGLFIKVCQAIQHAHQNSKPCETHRQWSQELPIAFGRWWKSLSSRVIFERSPILTRIVSIT
jgi:hypothetical protein